MPHAATETDTSTAGRGASIEVSSLWKEYPHGDHTVPVLRDVDLMLNAGDMVAIVGASGVGKSTLLHVLGTLDLPTRGSIRFNGEEITSMGPARLAEFRNREIGFVFQFHHLLPEFTALENVMMPALIQRIPRSRAVRDARDILGRVGLAQRLTHKPSELSGGEQQRVALARAMVLAPSLLLADEPTGNLDRRTGEEIHELFVELNRERGSTLLVVTHNRELAEMMPRCLRMLDGGGLEEVHERGAGFDFSGRPPKEELSSEELPVPTAAVSDVPDEVETPPAKPSEQSSSGQPSEQPSNQPSGEKAAPAGPPVEKTAKAAAQPEQVAVDGTSTPSSAGPSVEAQPGGAQTPQTLQGQDVAKMSAGTKKAAPGSRKIGAPSSSGKPAGSKPTEARPTGVEPGRRGPPASAKPSVKPPGARPAGAVPPPVPKPNKAAADTRAQASSPTPASKPEVS